MAVLHRKQPFLRNIRIRARVPAFVTDYCDCTLSPRIVPAAVRSDNLWNYATTASFLLINYQLVIYNSTLCSWATKHRLLSSGSSNIRPTFEFVILCSWYSEVLLCLPNRLALRKRSKLGFGRYLLWSVNRPLSTLTRLSYFAFCLWWQMPEARLPLDHDHLLLDLFQFILQEEHDPTLGT
jgi:hypothetical protein